jgi:methylenetetrahydrofolate dehydrogenase (NADP+)/methenyltetrahydrofolate cyclohydrolase
MALLLKGLPIAENIKNTLRTTIYAEKLTPRLSVILVGDDPASSIYVKRKQEACESVGIKSNVCHFQTNQEKEVVSMIESLNLNPLCNGILVQLPLPKSWNSSKIFETINPLKDVDVFNPVNVGLLLQNRPRFLPPTPHGIRELIIQNGLPLRGQHVVVINRSNIVGKPLSSMLIQDNGEYANSTVTVCHDNTPAPQLKELCLIADIIVVAVGIPNFLTEDMVKHSQVVIDVGINRINGKIVGDTHPTVVEKVRAISPVPGGVGPMTVAMLLHNTVEACKLQC